jgi:hypothetical protein
MLTSPGQESARSPAGKPHRQPAQQDQGRKVPGPEAGEGRPPAGAAQEGPGHPAGEGESFFFATAPTDADGTLPQKKEEARVAKERQEKKYQKDHAYDELFTDENMESTSNQNRDENWEDDFM